MNTFFWRLLAVLFIEFYVFNVALSTERQTLSLDKGWLFHSGDISFPKITGHNMTYLSAKAGTAWGAAAPDFDDSSWARVTLPHDWATEQPVNPNANISQGYKDRGIGWYRRSFKVSTEDKGKYFEIQFDAIASNAIIWVNGTVLHRSWCGYTSIYIDVTPYLNYGDKINVIAVRVDANTQEGWWYEGAGIYRHTWMLVKSPAHIETDGVYANPIKISEWEWKIPVETEVFNSSEKTIEIHSQIQINDIHGTIITKSIDNTSLAPLERKTIKSTLFVNKPVLWSIDNPTLYTVSSKIIDKAGNADEEVLKCGFRTIRFDADSGFYLNDKNIKIKGVSNHQDHAGVGVAVPDALWEFRVRKLKEMGANAYRCSHNPPAKEFLDVCDSLGMLVMDENRHFNTSPEYLNQLKWMVKRDRNRPSIILWSVFNEEPMQGTENGYEMVRRMSHAVKELDTTRCVTAAMNGGFFSEINVAQGVDVVGFNYQMDKYDEFHCKNPEMKLTSSEDVSAFIVRGEYKTDKTENITDSYDSECAPWGATHREGWKAVAERKYLAGCFIWTGFDYRGEPTPFEWPSVSSSFGIMDLCGFPKSAYYIHQAQWIENKSVLNIIPHWTWPADSIGKDIKVMVASNADSISLYLNKKFISGQLVDKYEMNFWLVPYEPGTLEAHSFVNNKLVKKSTVVTTTEPKAIKLTAYRPGLNGDGIDAMPITVEITDQKGRHIPVENSHVSLSIKGPGKIIGVGNGDPRSHEPEKGNSIHLFNGLAQIIIQSEEGVGDIVLTAKVQGLPVSELKIPVVSCSPKPYVGFNNTTKKFIIDKWLCSPRSEKKPDPTRKIEDNDMNSWEHIQTGSKTPLNKGSYVIYRTKINKQNNNYKRMSSLILCNTTGIKEIWVNGKNAEMKIDNANKSISVSLADIETTGYVSILFQSENNSIGIDKAIVINN